MIKLEEIFDRWSIDKGQTSGGPRAAAEGRGYAGVYECLFRRYRRDLRTILEIGIGTMIPRAHSSMANCALPGYRPGGSLRAWREYFANATIFAIDVQPDTQFDEDRIVTRLCDSTNQQSVQALMQRGEFPSQFDIIIDDASHKAADQIATLVNFLPYVKRGGFYIVEDIQEFIDHIDVVRKICGDNPFFFLGPCNNVFVLIKRESLEKGTSS